MIKIDNKKQCCGCNLCFNICPQNAIEMKEDKEGFKYPSVNKEKCIKCGLCVKKCPVKNKKEEKKRKIAPKVIAAWSNDENIRLDSTSGGIFSELAKKIYKEKGLVVGAIYDEEWNVKHIISKDIKDLDNIRSSKYLQSDVGLIYKKIKENLINQKIVLMCGSPCQISALYNYLGKDYENLITCDFICRGMNSPKIFKMYLNDLERKYKSKISKIKFKNKIHGWHNFSTKIDFENGKSYIGGRYVDSYMIGYLKYTAFMRPSCYECKFKEFPRIADITLADFWGIDKIDNTLDNNKGTSMILLNSDKGEKLFNDIKDNISFKEIKNENIFNENICINESPEETEVRKKVFENIDKYTYKELSNRFFPEPKRLEKIKIILRENEFFKKSLIPVYRSVKRWIKQN